MKPRSFSSYEPAERVVTVSLSAGEVAALVKHHSAQIRAIPRRLGKAALNPAVGGGFSPRGRTLRILHEQAKQLGDAHAARARELLKLIP